MMSSIVTEALASSGALAKDDISTKISKLSNHAFDVKQELCDYTEQCYVLPLLSSTKQTNAKLSTLRHEVNSLQLSLDSMVKNQIKDSTKEYEQLCNEHGKTLQLVAVLEKLNMVHTMMMTHNRNFNSKNMFQAAESIFKTTCETTWKTTLVEKTLFYGDHHMQNRKLVLKTIKAQDDHILGPPWFSESKPAETEKVEIEEFLKSMEESVLLETKIYKALRTEFIVKRENLLHTLDEIWNSCVSIIREEDGTVKIVVNFNKESEMTDAQDLVHALHVVGSLRRRMTKLSDVIMKDFIKPSVMIDAFLPAATQAAGAVLTGNLDENQSKDAQQKKVPEQIFSKLRTILGFLQDQLFKYQLSPDKDKNEDLMTIFRSLVVEDFLTLIVEQCLMLSVPNTKEDLQNFDKIEKQVKDFESILKQIGFISKDANSNLIDFVSNIHIHFANQRCRAVLTKARSLMKSEIYETVLVESTKFGEVPENLLEKLKSDKFSKKHELVVKAMTNVLKPSKPMNENTLCLPRFRISRAAKELVDLTYKTLHEAVHSTAECELRLVATAKTIFELYAAVVPVNHRESLTTLPQVSALFYNDCWYIAHHLLTMGHQFSDHLPTKESGVPLTFVHQNPVVRQLGSECLLSQMRRQREILLEFLTPLKMFPSKPNENKYQIAEKPIKQVSHVLHHLRTIWTDVLPSNVSRTCLATLADCVITETVNSICTVEDISSDDSQRYCNICRLLREQVSSLFDNEDDPSWQREVRKWQRLAELILVLDSNMRSIVDRWSDGKGPLATVFTVVEVKGLIRALFQNTDQRAKALSKIRY